MFWTNKNAQVPTFVGILIWVGFRKLFVVRFVLGYQKLRKGINMVQIKYMGSIKGLHVNFQINECYT